MGGGGESDETPVLRCGDCCRHEKLMFGLRLNPRVALVIAHDLAMTAAAIVASFYIRFEATGVAERLHTLLLFLPGFVVYAGLIYSLFHLYESKWRFASLPDLMNIVRAASVLAVSLLALDYVLVAPNVLGQFFFGRSPLSSTGSCRSRS